MIIRVIENEMNMKTIFENDGLFIFRIQELQLFLSVDETNVIKFPPWRCYG